MTRILAGNKVSLADQVARTLKQRVRTGTYRAGAPLPSVRTLSDEFGVSLNVVQRAVRHLEENGIVKTHPGKGMLVTQEDGCERAAIMFGFIHPYVSSMGFHRDVLEYVDEAFAERLNFAVVRSSKDNPTLEREIAEHLIANGVKGLILWPANDDPNGEYFRKLAMRVPVVLVDRVLPQGNLPAVVLDYYQFGRDVSTTLFGRMQKKRLLVLMDNLRISSYSDIVSGIESAAAELERSKDVTVVQIPITHRIIQKISRSDFTDVPEYRDYVERLLKDGGYDAVFCSQDEFVDYVMAQTGLMDEFTAVRTATLRSTCPNQRSIRYASLNCLEWQTNAGGMISAAADLVQRWVLSRQAPKGVLRLKLRAVSAGPEQNGDTPE